MGANLIPSREASLVAWSNNLSSLISATPTAFGLTAAQATAYATLNTALRRVGLGHLADGEAPRWPRLLEKDKIVGRNILGHRDVGAEE